MIHKLKAFTINMGIMITSVFASIIAIVLFGMIYVIGIEPIFRAFSVDIQNLISYIYLGFYVVFNLVISVIYIRKRIYKKFFMMYAPISFISTAPLVFFIGAFYR